jgi:hypothetical protein
LKKSTNEISIIHLPLPRLGIESCSIVIFESLSIGGNNVVSGITGICGRIERRVVRRPVERVGTGTGAGAGTETEVCEDEGDDGEGVDTIGDSTMDVECRVIRRGASISMSIVGALPICVNSFCELRNGVNFRVRVDNGVGNESLVEVISRIRVGDELILTVGTIGIIGRLRFGVERIDVIGDGISYFCSFLSGTTEIGDTAVIDADEIGD